MGAVQETQDALLCQWIRNNVLRQQGKGGRRVIRDDPLGGHPLHTATAAAFIPRTSSGRQGLQLCWHSRPVHAAEDRDESEASRQCVCRILGNLDFTCDSGRLLDFEMTVTSEWPQPGDSVLASSGNEKLHAQCHVGNWGIYPQAYLDAAELLVKAVASGSNPDLVVYPLMYLYRHYVELSVKTLIALGRALDSNPDLSSHPDHHKLAELWKEARPLIEKYCYRADEGRTDLEAVSAVIGQFAEIDPEGEIFRFHVTTFNKKSKRREKTIPVPLHLSLDQVEKVMKRVSSFFGGAEDVMDELRHYQADLESEC